jgi:hypothetical protein
MSLPTSQQKKDAGDNFYLSMGAVLVTIEFKSRPYAAYLAAGTWPLVPHPGHAKRLLVRDLG